MYKFRSYLPANSAGAYSIKVPVGTYTVHLGQPRPAKQPPMAFADWGMAMNLAGPKTVTVAAGQTVTADFTIVFNLL